MNISPKAKQKLYLYIEKEHGFFSTRLLWIAISSILFFLSTPKSVNSVIRREIRSGDFKTPIRRLNWLFSYSKALKQQFDDEFFDFSLGIDHQSALDMLKWHKLLLQPQSFQNHVHVAQLASRVIESQLSPGQSVDLNQANALQEYDDKYRKHLELALKSIKLECVCTSPGKSEHKHDKDAGTKVESSKPFEENTLAQDVFHDVINFMREHQSGVFAVSGTLLGIIREKELLSHDIDIDLGVMEEDIDVERLVNAIQVSDKFYIKKIDYPVLRVHDSERIRYIKMSIPSLIKFGHKRGLHIDLFVHFRDNKLRWHGSSLHRWDNSEFEIQSINFKGQTVNIPSNPERYLEENYGDWQTPKIDFNCSVDTPNIALQNSCKTICYFVKFLNLYRSDAEISNRILSMLAAQDIVIPPNLGVGTGPKI